MSKRKVKWHQGYYDVKNRDKYAGTIIENKVPFARSSWELTFMIFCDNNPNVISWVSEPLKIPYFNPIKNKQSVYVPDFIVCYQDKNGNKHMEMIEIKPISQAVITEKSSKKDVIDAKVNEAKWTAAAKFCKMNDLVFRILTKEDIYIK